MPPHDIAGFNIAVDDILAVDKCQDLQQILQNFDRDGFSNRFTWFEFPTQRMPDNVFLN